MFFKRCWKKVGRVPRTQFGTYQQSRNVYAGCSQSVLPWFKNVARYADKVALNDNNGSYTYENIFLSAKELAADISKKLEGKTNERILFMCPNNVNYVISLWAIWMSGQVAVPLSPHHPENLLLYYINDSKPEMLISSPGFKEISSGLAKSTQTKLLVLDDNMELNCSKQKAKTENDFEDRLPQSFYEKNDALIIYTSGTTGSPKGVVSSHKNLSAQVGMLLEAWKWTFNDAILHTLPLNHVHGVVNALLCPLTAGAKIKMLPKFDTKSVWNYLLGIDVKPDVHDINIYMAVPTIYFQLIDYFDRVFSNDEKMRSHILKTLQTKLRLMVSGSAPLPQTVFQRWLEISGHELLERYGMTEIGMCLSNPYDSKREAGFVGHPLPGVTVRISQKDDNDNFLPLVESRNTDGKVDVNISENANGENPSGHLLVKGEAVFKEYFRRPEATKKEFTEDGFFITGDICQYNTEKKLFKILGRESVDIIKSGGYKLSALQIETQLMNNPDIKECAVVGLPDDKWGERVAAVVVLQSGKSMTIDDLKSWANGKLPKYSTPSVLKIVEAIPKNNMGKVNKKELVKTMF